MEIAFISSNPYTGELYRIFDFDEVETLNQKIEASESAFKKWKKTSITERALLFKKMAALLREKALELAVIITEEMGKPIDQSLAEINKSALVCDYYAENAAGFIEAQIVMDQGQVQGKIFYEPLGIILQIMPWNFPFWQVFRCTAATLMAANVTILKHAPNVPRCSEAIVQLFEYSGFPKGVFQHIFARTTDLPNVLENPLIKGVALTGSVRAGSAVGMLAGKNIKPAVLELGGSDAFIVMADANLEEAAKAGVASRFANNGQTCIAAKRFILHEQIADKFMSMLKYETEKLYQGDPMKTGVGLSVMARQDLAIELQKQLDGSIRSGAEMYLKGGIVADSSIFRPVILENITKDCPAYHEEFFGPVLSCFSVKNEEEAVFLANDTEFGLGAALWTSNVENALELVSALDVGAISINQMVRSAPFMPFGGIKKSGIGKELGKEGIKAFLNIKTVMF